MTYKPLMNLFDLGFILAKCDLSMSDISFDFDQEDYRWFNAGYITYKHLVK